VAVNDLPRAATTTTVGFAPVTADATAPADWMTKFEQAFAAIVEAPDTPRIAAALVNAASEFVASDVVLSFAAGSQAPTAEGRECTVLPLKSRRTNLGSLVVQGRLSQHELRTLGLLSQFAANLAARTIHTERLHVAQRHERNAVAIYEAARDLVTIREVDVVLRDVVRRAQESTGADIAYLALHLRGSEVYRHHASSGTSSGSFDSIQVAGLRGLTELVARERQVIVSNDYFNDQRRNRALDRYLKAEALASLACAPMHMGAEFIGAMFAAKRPGGSFSDADADLLGALGAIAAGAIVNARLHDEEQRGLAELSAINRVVAAQHAQLSRWIRTHQRLTRMVLDGQGLARTAGLIARLMGGAVAILDRHLELLVFADPARAAADQPADDWARSALPLALHAASKPLRRITLIELSEGGSAIVAPVTSGRDTLGYLAILSPDDGLDDHSRMFVGQAANVVAIEFMQERIAAEVETRLRGELVGELISQSRADLESLRRRASLLGHGLDGELRLIVARPDSEPSKRLSDELRVDGPMVAVMSQCIADDDGGPLLAVRNGRAIALQTRKQAGDLDRRRRSPTAQDLREEISARHGHEVSLVAGQWVTDPRELAASYAAIVRSMDVFDGWGRRAYAVDFETSALERVLADLTSTADAASFVESALGRIIEYDKRRSGALLDSLEQYLLADSALETAARRLNVHPHTLRYRLDRVSKIIGRSLRDSDTKLEMMLALRMHRGLGR
jgi:sugar diacid utilization regulator